MAVQIPSKGGSDISHMNKQQLLDMVLKIRADIRWHRDMRGDDRCWLDHVKVYDNLPGYMNPFTNHVPPKAQFMALCRNYKEKSQVPNEHVTPEEATQPANADDDLKPMDERQLRLEIVKLRDGISRHLMKFPWDLDWHDDQELYNLLPEKTKAITALPPELLDNCSNFADEKLSEHPPQLHSWTGKNPISSKGA